MNDKLFLKENNIAMRDNVKDTACSLTAGDRTSRADGRDTEYVSGFGRWFLGVLRNSFNNHCRHSVQSTAQNQADELCRIEIAVASDAIAPEGSFAVSEVSGVVNSFSSDYRELYTMYLAGYQYKEIAGSTGLSVGVVKSRISAARRRMQDIMQAYGY